MDFATDMLWRIEDHERFLTTILFSDEACFHISGTVNRHNILIWWSENPHEYREMARDSPKVNVWCALIHDRIIGSFFFAEKTVTSVIYLDMLQNFVFPQTEVLQPEIVFQQDSTRQCATSLEHHSSWCFGQTFSRKMDWTRWSNFLAPKITWHNPTGFFPLGICQRHCL